jgi:KUP system potassium uptake protein
MAPAQHQAAADRGSREEIVIVDLESEAGADDAAAAAATMQRQDSLYAAATRAAGANHHGQVRCHSFCTTS